MMIASLCSEIETRFGPPKSKAGPRRVRKRTVKQDHKRHWKEILEEEERRVDLEGSG